MLRIDDPRERVWSMYVNHVYGPLYFLYRAINQRGEAEHDSIVDATARQLVVGLSSGANVPHGGCRAKIITEERVHALPRVACIRFVDERFADRAHRCEDAVVALSLTTKSIDQRDQDPFVEMSVAGRHGRKERADVGTLKTRRLDKKKDEPGNGGRGDTSRPRMGSITS